jgi:DNA-binding ferritin-like protein (Dps family)
MTMGWLEKVTGSFEQKKRYRRYKARVKELPEPYRAANEAVERFAMYASGIADGELAVRMLEDLVELFEQSAANGTPIRDVVGDDPVEFAETFLANYAAGSWINKEKKRLTEAIERAEDEEDQS